MRSPRNVKPPALDTANMTNMHNTGFLIFTFAT